MKLLVIDTSKPQALVALAEDGVVNAQRIWQSTPGLGQQLLVSLDEILNECGWQVADLARIAVHRGPGATSAVRQGVITAAMLAQTIPAQLVEVQGDTIEQLIETAHTAPVVDIIQPDYQRMAS